MNSAIFAVSRRPRLAGAIALAVLALPPAANSATPGQADAFPDFDSYIKVSGQAPIITGDGAAFATRTGAPTAGSGGIEDLYYSKDVSKDSTLVVNGRAMAGTDDFLASFNLSKNDFGSIEVGYKRFRTFYDGVGGFFPLNDTFQKNGIEQLHVDRGAFWLSATLAKPDRPVFSLIFRDETRTGQKDSSEWAAIVNPNAVVVNGVLVGTAVPSNTPFIAPNVLNMDERHRILEGSMTATFGKVTETLKATGDWANNNDARTYQKYPGSTVIADPTVTVLDDQELYKTNNFRLLSQTNVKFNEFVGLDAGLSYSHVSTSIGGNWITPAYSSTLKTVYSALTAGDIYGGARNDSYVGNLFLHLTPNRNWSADLGIRDEATTTVSHGGFTTTSLASGAKSTASNNFTVAQDVTYSHYVDHIVTPEISLQYLGLSRTSLYATFDDRINRGDQHWINPYAAMTTAGITGVVSTAGAPLGSVFFQDANQNNKDLKVGANWNAAGWFTVRAEVFRKDHQNRFIGANDYVGTASYGALYATGYTFTGIKLSVIFKPSAQLTFNTRYQPQTGTIDVTANSVTGGTGTVGNEITSGRARGQMISESVDWTPAPRFYVQGNVNVVYNYLQTAYPAVVVSTSANVPRPIQNADNNYITGSVLCGFVVDKLNDAQIQGYWTKAGNYNPQIAPGGQAYGAGFEEQSITVGLKHKFSSRLYGEGKAGYLRRIDDTTGNFTDYHGPLLYLSLTCAL